MNRPLVCTMVCWLAGTAFAQQPVAPREEAPAPAARFAAPVLLKSGEAQMGAKRLYPSPVLHDANGDGRADVVIGDLPGRFTVAPRLEGESAAFGPEEPLLARDGTALDFSNW